MKNILVATDFSPAALNAVKYAAALAKYNRAQLHILHVYHTAMVNGEVPIAADTNKFENECYTKLEGIAEELRLLYNIEPSLKIQVGFAVEMIERYVSKKSIDLVIMGMREYGKAEELFIGSTTVAFLKKSVSPLLVVPEFATYKDPKRIAFATDLKEIKLDSLKLLKEIAESYDAQVLIVNVAPKEELPNYEKSLAGIQIDRYLEDSDHLFLFPEGTDPIEGIDSFIAKNGADWITMVPHKHTLLEKIFSKSISKAMIYRTKLPLLLFTRNLFTLFRIYMISIKLKFQE